MTQEKAEWGIMVAAAVLLMLFGLTFCDGAEASDPGVIVLDSPPELTGYELFYCGELIGVILPEPTQHTVGAGWADLDVLLFDWTTRGGQTVIIHVDKMRQTRTLCPTQM